VRGAALREAAYDVICCTALRYGQQEAAASQLLARARKHEHMGAAAAAAAKHAEERYNSTQLVRPAGGGVTVPCWAPGVQRVHCACRRPGRPGHGTL
jgi:hypothetical protein